MRAVCRTAPTANPPNGNFSCPTNRTAGQTCTAQCNSGYTGSPTVTCSATGAGGTGLWGAISGTCTPGGTVLADVGVLASSPRAESALGLFAGLVVKF
jgi:hypothetical protein